MQINKLRVGVKWSEKCGITMERSVLLFEMDQVEIERGKRVATQINQLRVCVKGSEKCDITQKWP